MGNSGLKAHYDTAAKTGVLKISNEKLKEFSLELRQVGAHLRNLDLSTNHFKIIPNSIAEFKLLKQLNMSHNSLERLPECIGELIKLENINVSYNRIFSLPSTMDKLINLKQVHLNNNMLSDFPDVLNELKHLDVLELSHNRITEIPDYVEQMQMSELNMNQNRVAVISERVANCSKLKVLRLEENCLPLSMVHLSILRDSKLHTLCLDGNLFDSKQLMALEGYDDYMERFTAVKKKMF